jgi:hypothetical protein
MNIIDAIERALKLSHADIETIERLGAMRMEPLLSASRPGWSVDYSTAEMLEMDRDFERVDVTDAGEASIIEMR